MPDPLIDEQGKFIQPALRSLNRYIEFGLHCILKLKIEDVGNPDAETSIQFSMTVQQCRDLAENLAICAAVIELERPTSPPQ